MDKYSNCSMIDPKSEYRLSESGAIVSTESKYPWFIVKLGRHYGRAASFAYHVWALSPRSFHETFTRNACYQMPMRPCLSLIRRRRQARRKYWQPAKWLVQKCRFTAVRIEFCLNCLDLRFGGFALPGTVPLCGGAIKHLMATSMRSPWIWRLSASCAGHSPTCWCQAPPWWSNPPASLISTLATSGRHQQDSIPRVTSRPRHWR